MAKKVLAVMLALAMIFSLAACANSGSKDETTTKAAETTEAAKEDDTTKAADSEDTTEAAADTTAAQTGDLPEVSFYFLNFYSSFTQSGINRVDDAINAKLAERGCNFKFKMVPMALSEADTVRNLAIASGEADIVEYGGIANTYNYYKNGQVLDMTSYYDAEKGGMHDAYEEYEIDAGRIDGGLYAFNRKYVYGRSYVLRTSIDVMEKMGWTEDDIEVHSMDDVEKLLVAVKENLPEIQYPLAPYTGMMSNGYPDFGTTERLSRNLMALLNEDGTVTAIPWFESEALQDVVRHYYKWVEEGLAYPDAQNNTTDSASFLTNGQSAFYFLPDDISTCEEGITKAKEPMFPFQIKYTNLTDIVFSISSQTKHPQESYDMLSLILSDPEISTLVFFGEENVDWVYNADGLVDFPEGKTAESSEYGSFGWPWANGNPVITPMTVPQGPDWAEKVVKLNEESTVSPLMGFMYHNDQVEDESIACEEISTKYYQSLMCGLIDIDEYIDEMREEWQKAGGEKLIEDAQRQLDEFFANK